MFFVNFEHIADWVNSWQSFIKIWWFQPISEFTVMRQGGLFTDITPITAPTRVRKLVLHGLTLSSVGFKDLIFYSKDLVELKLEDTYFSSSVVKLDVKDSETKAKHCKLKTLVVSQKRYLFDNFKNIVNLFNQHVFNLHYVLVLFSNWGLEKTLNRLEVTPGYSNIPSFGYPIVNSYGNWHNSKDANYLWSDIEQSEVLPLSEAALSRFCAKYGYDISVEIILNH